MPGTSRGSETNESIFDKMLEELNSAPETSANGFVFPWNKCLGSYDLQSFSSAYSQGRVTDTDVNQVVGELKKSSYYNPTILDRRFISIVAITGCLAAVLAILMGGVSVQRLLKKLLIAALAVDLAILVIYLLFRISRLPKVPQNRTPELNKILQRVQSQLFAGRAVQLSISPHGSYIKLEFKGLDGQSHASAGRTGHGYLDQGAPGERTAVPYQQAANPSQSVIQMQPQLYHPYQYAPALQTQVQHQYQAHPGQRYPQMMPYQQVEGRLLAGPVGVAQPVKVAPTGNESHKKKKRAV